MVGSLLAGDGRDARRGVLVAGPLLQAYRGMGSVSAMARGSADRYFQQDIKDTLKLVPEGIEGQVPYKGRSAMWCISWSAACARRWAMSGPRRFPSSTTSAVRSHHRRRPAREPRARRDHHARSAELSGRRIRINTSPRKAGRGRIAQRSG